MRGLLVLGAIAACGGSERPATVIAPPGPAPIASPGLRLPDTVTPLRYDVTLDVDPDNELFTGTVAIDIRIERATDHVWLHADQLAIHKATWPGGVMEPVEDVRGEQMRAFRFGRVVEPGTTQLRLTFTGRTTGDQEGLFRQREGGDWYVFSQGEAVFARRIVPCFDEPRWKTPWQLTLVVPRRQVALANMPETATVPIADGKKRITFAETPPLPSYLLALAVGPFELVDAGTVGRNAIPVRVAVRPGAAKNVGIVAQRLPAIVDALELYLDDPLPVTKLDLVGVPQFFGAMENPGLVTFHEPILVGNPKVAAFASYFTFIAAHELVHQWFGNSVTPAWWDHLWLSEAFASWLGDKVVRELGAYDDAALRFALSRREAIAADRERGAKPLWRHVTTTVDADEGFDAIAYAKGQLVLATFESFVGPDAFRDRVRAYIKSQRGRSVTSDDLVRALGVPALKQFAAATGTPVVDMSLRCNAKPVLVAASRGDEVPVCFSYGGAKGSARSCALVGASVELPVGDTCPAWLRGNSDGGYYHVAWATQSPRGPAPKLADLDAAARIIAGDDVAATVQRGEVTAVAALSELRSFADSRDVYAQLGAVALARALDGFVDETARPAWTQWLAGRFGGRLAYDRRPLRPAEAHLAEALIGVVPADQFANTVTRRAHELLDKVIPAARGDLPAELVALGGVHGADKLFDRISARARLMNDEDVRATWIEALGELPVSQVPKAVALVTNGELDASTAWLAIARYLARPDTRLAAWRAVHAQLPAIRGRFAASEVGVVLSSLVHLCDARSRAEVAAAFREDKDVTNVLAAIDRCIATRDKLGDFSTALRNVP